MLKELFAKNVVEVSGITSEQMKKEWSDEEYKNVPIVVFTAFIGKTLENHRGEKRKIHTLSGLNDFFGLPYTSSSSFAMISNTNTRLCLDKEELYNIDCFGLGYDDKVYIFATDAEENEKVYKII